MEISMNIVYLFIALCTFSSVANKSSYNHNYVVDFLSEYGYLEKGLLGPNSNKNEQYMKEAISDYQYFSGIEVTGVMDNNTMRMMRIPRCGVKDKVTSREVNQFVLKGGKWESERLTFAILNYPKHLKKKDVISEITLAFHIWTKYTNLIFVKKNPGKYVNIMIAFANGSHNDGKPFDGPGNVVGHAFPHNNANRGKLHLDITENWTINSEFGINLYQVVVHEIGHVLGLDHSMFNTSIMTPNYVYNETFRSKLSQDDILAIQSLYGTKRKTTKKPKKKLNKPNKKVLLCNMTPSQFYRYSPETKKFLLDTNSRNAILKDYPHLKLKRNANKDSGYNLYKILKYLLCRKINIDT